MLSRKSRRETAVIKVASRAFAPHEGFRLELATIEGRPPEPCIVHPAAMGEDFHAMKYDPHLWNPTIPGPVPPEEPLYRTFARLEPTPEAILAFANLVGPLAFLEDIAGKPGEPVLTGEPLRTWRSEIVAMRAIIALWNASREPGSIYLEDHITISDGVATYSSTGRTLREDTERRVPHFGQHVQIPNIEVKDPRRLAAFTIFMEAVDERLQEHVSVGMTFKEAPGVEAADNPVAPLVEPRNLLGALWLDLSVGMSKGNPL